MKLEAGDVVLLRFPHTDLAAGKQRPALVLTPSKYNDHHPDVVAAYVTSQPQADPWSLPITSQQLRSGRLVKPSWVRSDRLATLDKGLVTKVAGRLDHPTLQQVRARVGKLLEI